jgi:CMP-N,N'-diacetyllegionaminic acid synthase
MKKSPSIIALIPARSGSKRIEDKNILPLTGHPLIAYTVSAALQSGVFDDVVVSTDSKKYAQIAEAYGAQVPFLRPAKISTAVSTDFEWIDFTLKKLSGRGKTYQCFSILRPTSPFRTPEMIKRAWSLFLKDGKADSLRAVEKCSQHPGKMWIVKGKHMQPLLPFTEKGQPWHSRQYPSLPEVHVQNASLEIARTKVIYEDKNISGSSILPFITKGYEGFDINNPLDLKVAKELVRSGEAVLPAIRTKK